MEIAYFDREQESEDESSGHLKEVCPSFHSPEEEHFVRCFGED
jgi:hypothetical protein